MSVGVELLTCWQKAAFLAFLKCLFIKEELFILFVLI